MYVKVRTSCVLYLNNQVIFFGVTIQHPKPLQQSFNTTWPGALSLSCSTQTKQEDPFRVYVELRHKRTGIGFGELGMTW